MTGPTNEARVETKLALAMPCKEEEDKVHPTNEARAEANLAWIMPSREIG